MFTKLLHSQNEAFSLYITIKCDGRKKFCLYAEDHGKVNSKYADRVIDVDGERTIYFSFPVSPMELAFVCYNANNRQDTEYTVELKKEPLKSYEIWLEQNTRDFLKLAIPFSQVCGFEKASQNGRIFTDDNKEFKIKFFDIIRDYASGQPMNTPARIGHKTGNIEIAKVKYDKYTIPMRMAILLHEYCHVFKNPKIGLEISNEVGADINALYIYLGLGFSKIDAICVYANVFLKAQTKGNVERMRKIMDYINRFELGEFALKK